MPDMVNLNSKRIDAGKLLSDADFDAEMDRRFPPSRRAGLWLLPTTATYKERKPAEPPYYCMDDFEDQDDTDGASGALISALVWLLVVPAIAGCVGILVWSAARLAGWRP